MASNRNIIPAEIFDLHAEIIKELIKIDLIFRDSSKIIFLKNEKNEILNMLKSIFVKSISWDTLPQYVSCCKKAMARSESFEFPSEFDSVLHNIIKLHSYLSRHEAYNEVVNESENHINKLTILENFKSDFDQLPSSHNLNQYIDNCERYINELKKLGNKVSSFIIKFETFKFLLEKDALAIKDRVNDKMLLCRHYLALAEEEKEKKKLESEWAEHERVKIDIVLITQDYHLQQIHILRKKLNDLSLIEYCREIYYVTDNAVKICNEKVNECSKERIKFNMDLFQKENDKNISLLEAKKYFLVRELFQRLREDLIHLYKKILLEIYCRSLNDLKPDLKSDIDNTFVPDWLGELQSTFNINITIDNIKANTIPLNISAIDKIIKIVNKIFQEKTHPVDEITKKITPKITGEYYAGTEFDNHIKNRLAQIERVLHDQLGQGKFSEEDNYVIELMQDTQSKLEKSPAFSNAIAIQASQSVSLSHEVSKNEKPTQAEKNSPGNTNVPVPETLEETKIDHQLRSQTDEMSEDEESKSKSKKRSKQKTKSSQTTSANTSAHPSAQSTTPPKAKSGFPWRKAGLVTVGLAVGAGGAAGLFFTGGLALGVYIPVAIACVVVGGIVGYGTAKTTECCCPYDEENAELNHTKSSSNMITHTLKQSSSVSQQQVTASSSTPQTVYSQEVLKKKQDKQEGSQSRSLVATAFCCNFGEKEVSTQPPEQRKHKGIGRANRH